MITYSIEKLYHFNCDRCSKWWTIGDWTKQPIICPWCGKVDMRPIKRKVKNESENI